MAPPVLLSGPMATIDGSDALQVTSSGLTPTTRAGIWKWCTPSKAEYMGEKAIFSWFVVHPVAVPPLPPPPLLPPPLLPPPVPPVAPGGLDLPHAATVKRRPAARPMMQRP